MIRVQIYSPQDVEICHHLATMQPTLMAGRRNSSEVVPPSNPFEVRRSSMLESVPSAVPPGETPPAENVLESQIQGRRNYSTRGNNPESNVIYKVV